MLPILFSTAFAEDVQVSSNLEGARILVNGVDTGRVTPATLTGVAPGSVQIAVTQGCARGDAVVNVVKGQGARASILAIPDVAMVTMRVEPAGARVYMDGAPYPGPIGEPFEIECGSHEMRGEAEGYLTATTTFEVDALEKVDVSLKLSRPGMGVFDLSVQPRTATLTLDGKPVGTDAVTLPSVSEGSHTLGAMAEGYKAAEIDVRVAQGVQEAWHFELVRESSRKESTATSLLGPRRGETIAASGANAGQKTTAASAEGEELDDPEPPPARSTSGTSSSTSKSTTSSSSSGSSTSGSSASGSSSGTTSKSSGKASSGGSDYFSRLRAQEGESGTTEELDEPEAEEPAPTKRTSSAAASESGTSRSSNARASETASARESSVDGAARREKNPKAGLDIAGVTLMGLGAGSGGAAVYFFDATSRAYTRYTAKDEAAREQNDPDLAQEASEIYDTEVTPNKLAMFGTAGASGALLLTGLILVVVDVEGPYVAPLPGGGALLGWTVGF